MKKYICKILKSKKAEVFVDSGVKILIAVVIGALLLGGVYTVFSDTVLPTAKSKVESLFDYAGGMADVEPEPEPTMIKFYVNDIEYQAEENMTWQDWLNSGYNTSSLIAKENRLGHSNYYTYLFNKDKRSVYLTDAISEKHRYEIFIEWPEIPD